MASQPVYVVGGGVAGLSAAATLAIAGEPVVVLDAATVIGGRARTHWVDRFGLNVGPHALYVGGPGARRLRRLGVDLRGGQPRTWAFQVVVGDELVGLGRLLLGSRSRLAALRAASGRWGRVAPGASAAEHLAGLTLDDRSRAVVEMVVRLSTYAGDLHRLDAAMGAAQLRLATLPGVRYLHRGWQGLADDLARVIRRHGGAIRTGVPVAAVEHDERVIAVRTRSGERLPADRVVVAMADAGRAVRLLAGPGADRLAAATADHTVVRMAHLDVALRRSSGRVRSLLDPAGRIYVSVPSDVARLAPRDGVVLHAGRYLEPGGERADHRADLEAAIDRVAPHWRDDLVDARYVPTSPVAGDHAGPGAGGWAGRVGVDGAGVAGLAVAGDWVRGQGMLADAAITSGDQAARALLTAARATPTPSRGVRSA